MASDKTESAHIDVYPVEGFDIPNARLGHFTVRFTGATGLVGTAFGRPHTTATRISTGIYKVDHPATRDNRIFAQVSVPTQYTPTGLLASGVSYDVEIVNRSPTSGTFEFHVKAPTPSGTFKRHANPVAGVEIDLFFMSFPLDKF